MGWAAALEFSRYVLKFFFAPSLLQTLNSKAKPGASGEQEVPRSLGKQTEPSRQAVQPVRGLAVVPTGQTSQ